MVTPNVWGQGQLFAFSALDGRSLWGDDFVGTLSGDKVGIRFHTNVKRELAIVNLRGMEPVFDTVASDVILLNTNEGRISVIYADTHTVIGNVAGSAAAVVMTEGDCRCKALDGIRLQDTQDGEFTAFIREGNRFCLAFGHTEEAAAAKAKQGIRMDPDTVIAQKLRFFKDCELDEGHPYRLLNAKCLSVMKSQLYSPEGKLKRIWSTPDRLPHKHLWLWDSVFHAVGFRNFDASLAEELILAVLDCQEENGFIPHCGYPDGASEITQPPVLAWGAWKVCEKSGNMDFLKTVFEANEKFLLWCRENRRDTQDELYTWLTKDDVNCRCDESGMDNSPRFDSHSRLQAIDLSCFMANEARAMAKIAARLRDAEKEEFYTRWYHSIRKDINSKLWCADEGFYYDYDLTNGALHKVQSVASFLPLFAGVCDGTQAAALVAKLLDPETFGTTLPIPSISRQDPTYGSDMWRGPVWINYNYMISDGLAENGYPELALAIRTKTVKSVNDWYMRTGTVYEFYDPEHQQFPGRLNRKGAPYEPYDFTVRYQSIRDYGWSNTLVFDLLQNNMVCAENT